MDTAWIQVFVLILSECVAPEGKVVCQQQEFELTFAERADCEFALAELVDIKGRMDDVIVDRDESRCVATAKPVRTWPDLAAVEAVHGEDPDWRAPARPEEAPTDLAREAHEARLAALPECDENDDVRPCKVGRIILEETEPEKVEVWRRQQ